MLKVAPTMLNSSLQQEESSKCYSGDAAATGSIADPHM